MGIGFEIILGVIGVRVELFANHPPGKFSNFYMPNWPVETV